MLVANSAAHVNVNVMGSAASVAHTCTSSYAPQAVKQSAAILSTSP